MKTYLFDSSVYWLKEAVHGKIGFLISAHTLAELFSVLTGMPASPKISPSQAKLLIEKNTGTAKIIEINAKDYHNVISILAELNLSGGIIYDALAAYSARKAKADYILTFNENDFKKFEIKYDFPKIVSP